MNNCVERSSRIETLHLKQIVSVSLGSSQRDKTVTASFLGQEFSVSRVGVNGDMKAYAEKLAELDGKVDVFGLGGTDLYIYAGDKRYTFGDIAKMIEPAKKTPIVDGSGLKNTLERETISYLQQNGIVNFRGSKTLMVCAVDRFGMAEALAKIGGDVVYGDLMFNLDIPIAIKSFGALQKLANVLLPILVRLPFTWFYPTGEKQNSITPKWEKYYHWADIICGDFLLIRKCLPDDLTGKVILTNTTTAEDKVELAKRGVKTLITTTPEFDGRSFGTNVMEGVLVALSGETPDKLNADDYMRMLRELGWQPRIEQLAPAAAPQTATAAV